MGCVEQNYTGKAGYMKYTRIHRNLKFDEKKGDYTPRKQQLNDTSYQKTSFRLIYYILLSSNLKYFFCKSVDMKNVLSFSDRKY